MKLPTRAKYAVRMMVVLDRLGARDHPVHLGEVAEITGISRRYMEQLATALKSHSLLRGVSGRGGGYLLARPPSEISVGAVLTAVVGPINLSICIDEPRVCSRAAMCECRMIWSLLNQRLREVLDIFTVADLSDKDRMGGVRDRLVDIGEIVSN